MAWAFLRKYKREVPTIGRAFVDEIFRVFASSHPKIELVPIQRNRTPTSYVHEAFFPQIREGISRRVYVTELTLVSEIHNQSCPQIGPTKSWLLVDDIEGRFAWSVTEQRSEVLSRKRSSV
jgi:hypothetical protein